MKRKNVIKVSLANEDRSLAEIIDPQFKADVFSLTIAIIIMGFDLFTAQQYELLLRRAALGVAGVTILSWQYQWNWSKLGFRSPQSGWKYWIKGGAALGIVVLLLVLGGYFLLSLSGENSNLGWTFKSRADFIRWVFNYGIIIPIEEELIYRTVLCVPLFSLVGFWPTVIVGGTVFSFLHFIYGNPAPENFIGGFILVWVFLKSRSILVPLGLHVSGNVVAALSHL